MQAGGFDQAAKADIPSVEIVDARSENHWNLSTRVPTKFRCRNEDASSNKRFDREGTETGNQGREIRLKAIYKDGFCSHPFNQFICVKQQSGVARAPGKSTFPSQGAIENRSQHSLKAGAGYMSAIHYRQLTIRWSGNVLRTGEHSFQHAVDVIKGKPVFGVRRIFGLGSGGQRTNFAQGIKVKPRNGEASRHLRTADGPLQLIKHRFDVARGYRHSMITQIIVKGGWREPLAVENAPDGPIVNTGLFGSGPDSDNAGVSNGYTQHIGSRFERHGPVSKIANKIADPAKILVFERAHQKLVGVAICVVDAPKPPSLTLPFVQAREQFFNCRRSLKCNVEASVAGFCPIAFGKLRGSHLWRMKRGDTKRLTPFGGNIKRKLIQPVRGIFLTTPPGSHPGLER